MALDLSFNNDRIFNDEIGQTILIDSGRQGSDLRTTYRGQNSDGSSSLTGETTSQRGGRTPPDSEPVDTLTDIVGDTNSDNSVEDQQSKLDDIFRTMFGGDGSLGSMANKVWTILSQIYQSINNSSNQLGIDTKDERRGMAEQIMNLVYNFALTQYTNAYQQQTWLQQQEFNSPSNQMQRYIDAGLNPIAFLGQISNGNAENSSGVKDTPVSEIDSEKINGKQLQWDRALGAIGMACQLGTTATGIGQSAANIQYLQSMTDNVKNQTFLQSRQSLSNLRYMDSLTAGQRIKNALSDKELSKWNETYQNNMAMTLAQTDGIKSNCLLGLARLSQDAYQFDKAMSWNRESMQNQNQQNALNRSNAIDVANIGAAASMYGADQSLAGTKYSADTVQATSMLTSLSGKTVKSKIVKDGKELSREASLRVQEQLGHDYALIKMNADGSFTYRNRKTNETITQYTETTLSNPHILTDYLEKRKGLVVSGQIPMSDYLGDVDVLLDVYEQQTNKNANSLANRAWQGFQNYFTPTPLSGPLVQ